VPVIRPATEFAPEFIEEELIAATERFLGGFEGRMGFRQMLEINRISQQVEGELGYDGVLTSIVPFYLQFKVSYFSTPAIAGKLRTNRDTLGLKSDRGFYRFSLLKDKTSKQFDQHNALFKLSRTYPAAYVAPPFYRKTNLTSLRRRREGYPWTYERIVHLHDSHDMYCVSLANVRQLANLVTIPPHKTLAAQAGLGHQYSYIGRGDIAFHEGERIENATPAFIDFLLGLVPDTEKAMRSLTLEVMASRVLALMAHLLEEAFVNQGAMKAFDVLGAVEKLTVFEKFLWNHYRIRQYMVFIYH